MPTTKGNEETQNSKLCRSSGSHTGDDNGDGLVGDGTLESTTLPNERKSHEGRTKSVETAPTQSDPTVELHNLNKTKK